MGNQFSISVLLNLRSESVGAQNFEILAEDSNTGGPNSFTVRMDPVDTGRKLNVLNVFCTFNLRPVSAGEYLFAFQFLKKS